MGGVDDVAGPRCACSGGGIDGLRGWWGLGILMLSASHTNKCKEMRRLSLSNVQQTNRKQILLKAQSRLVYFVRRNMNES